MTPSIAQDALGACGSYSTPQDAFHKLVSDLATILGSSSGLDSSDVDVSHLEQLMAKYASNEKEWSKYAFSDFSRGYTRNLVDVGNGKSNLVSPDTFGKECS